MIDPRNRVPTNPGRVQIAPEGGIPYYAIISRADNPVTVGTPYDRVNLDRLQGYCACHTVFNADGGITDTYPGGVTVKTVFNADGTIDEIRTSAAGTDTKRTIFNPGGSIDEVMI